jgi:hypothetical protein
MGFSFVFFIVKQPPFLVCTKNYRKKMFWKKGVAENLRSKILLARGQHNSLTWR